MLAIFNITAPIFMIIGMGYLAVRFQVFQPLQLQAIAKFVLKFGLPSLVLYAIATKPIMQVFEPVYMAGYTLASLMVYGIGWLVSRKVMGGDKLWAAIGGFGMSMSNTGFIGYPLLAMVIGSEAGAYFAMNVLVENLFILPLLFILADSAKSNEQHAVWRLILNIGKNLLKNPIILAMMAGLVFSLGWLPLPVAVEKVSGMLAAATAPVALFVIGGGLYGLKIRGSIPDIIMITAGKLVLHPLLVVAMLWLLGADAAMLFAGALLASVPMASMFPLIGQQYGFNERPAAAMLVTTVLSFASIFFVLWVSNHSG